MAVYYKNWAETSYHFGAYWPTSHLHDAQTVWCKNLTTSLTTRHTCGPNINRSGRWLCARIDSSVVKHCQNGSFNVEVSEKPAMNIGRTCCWPLSTLRHPRPPPEEKLLDTSRAFSPWARWAQYKTSHYSSEIRSRTTRFSTPRSPKWSILFTNNLHTVNTALMRTTCTAHLSLLYFDLF
jgi:hypothetical protein